jgi:hypothetical protein
MKTIDFRVKGDDPSLSTIKGMLNGIAHHTGDKSLVITETRLLSVTTERDDVAAILTSLAKANAILGPKRIYKQRKQQSEDNLAIDPQPAP